MDTAAASRTRSSDFAWGSIVSGAYASAATALLFLLVDGVQGQPLHTASLLGSVVLLGQDPGAVGTFRLDMVALYSFVHLGAFVLIGAGATSLYVRWRFMRRPLVLVAALTGVLTAGALTVDALLHPGLVSAVGELPLVAGNLSAAIAMAWVLQSGLGSSAHGTARA